MAEGNCWSTSAIRSRRNPGLIILGKIKQKHTYTKCTKEKQVKDYVIFAPVRL